MTKMCGISSVDYPVREFLRCGNTRSKIMEQNLTGADRPPSYSSIAASSAASSQYPQPTAPEYESLTAPAPQAFYVYDDSFHTLEQQIPSFDGHIAFACIVLWLCNLVFGFLAFIFAGQYRIYSVSEWVVPLCIRSQF